MQRYWALYAMLLLPLAFFLVFRYWPMGNLLIAFTENNIIRPIWELQWVGFDNFRQAIDHPPFWPAFRNTIMFSLLDLAAGFPAPIILALLLNELKFRKFKRVTQTISYMPHFLSWIIISGMAIRLFSTNVGTVNNILYNTFGREEGIPFLTSNWHWVATVVFLGVWRSLGWNTILYLAAITGVNPELYEAADMDGASRIRKMWHVTLPGIRPVIIILFILSLGGMMGADFERFMALHNPLVDDVATVLPMYVWQWGIQRPHVGQAMATAVGLMQNVINFGLLLGANFIVKKLGGSGLW
jgi:putative aldouronate transport system permease protein